MQGYIQNKTHIWAHAMKRSIGPNAKVTLKELYEQYGTKHNLKKGTEFVTWLRTVKLRDNTRWRIVFEDTEILGKKEDESSPQQIQKEPIVRNSGRKEATVNTKDMEIKDVVGLSVRKAREVLPNITDLNLLKYSVQEANQLANKDTLVRMLRKRIQELDLAR
ncbi:MAG: hypothetical protein DRO67_08375 [Candidatus Asgardarchaeum californiense]|nr:MAG: hypothetical protein DRO67_08375 [Candidatus Asgardarchaeum californiense]